MKIECLMSGWRITEYGELNYPCQVCVCLTQLDSMKPTTAKWVMEHYNFHPIKKINRSTVLLCCLPRELIGKDIMVAWLDHDDEEKIAIMENHPDLEEQLAKRFGEKWADHYLRFNQ